MQQSNQNMENKNNDLTEIITQALNEMKMELGESFNIDKVNLAELERRTGITRAKLRRLKSNGFIDKPQGLTGRKAEHTVLSGYTAVIDNLLGKSITNASLIHERIGELGYSGGLTSIKDYIAQHRDLIPAKRQLVAPQGSRGTRYQSEPGESYQMDWGFVTVEDDKGNEYKVACFAMICHCCGQRYIEFFPNAKQENLFIGMIHAFLFMGVPRHVLTDNMKSVVTGRDAQGHPIWQKDYEIFMGNLCFETKLCKPRHPFTKGAVERLVRFAKENFLPGRIFNELTDLNYEVIRWCNTQNNVYHRAVDCVPNERHNYVFTESVDAKQNLVDAQEEGNNILAFMKSEGYLQFEIGKKISSTDFYNIYVSWCEDNLEKPRASAGFLHYIKENQKRYGLIYDAKCIGNRRGFHNVCKAEFTPVAGKTPFD